MGRAWKVSNPSEVNNSWVPAGDDAAGMYFTQQTYDWQGRPLITTNPDLTTKEVSYAGCGCAGGEVVTMTDEGTIDAGVAKRRQKKIYSDVLGRTVKTEVLNWQNGTVYSATTNTYNARDQVVQIRQYAGAEGSGTYQDTTMTYDGYGRLKTRHVPEQNVGTVTTWGYNADDTIQSITDARGASTTFTYNGRHLPNVVTHTLSGSNTLVESFGYDAAGNRTSMSDTSGGTTYQYNQLSQLTSETRTFAGLAGAYTLSYEYTLGGNLKSLTDHTNRKINYAYDHANRLDVITGTNYSTTQFVNNVDYRAWNVPRQVAFGNGRTLTMAYNSRLAVTHLEMPALGALSAVINKDYQYYSDNRVKYSQDHLEPRYDRSFNYDHSHRLSKALSGAEARGEFAGGNRPYNQFANYDAFDHLTGRTSRHWSKKFPYIITNSFSNNRRTGWQYDANGNLLNDGQRTFTFDAAGRLIASSGGNVGLVLDGDGRRVKSIEPNLTMYYLISTVLAGQTIAELDSSGNKQRGFLYAFDDVLAEEYANGSIVFVHKDALRLSVRKTNPTAGVMTEATELDPQGADVELEDPYLNEPEYDGRDEGGPMYPGFGNVTSPGNCTMDGIWMPCDMALRMYGSGAAAVCPNNDCGPQPIWVKNSEGTTVSYFTTGFRAFANGVGGYFQPHEIAGTAESQAEFWHRMLTGPANDTNFTTIDGNANGSGSQFAQDDDAWMYNNIGSIGNDTEHCSISVRFVGRSKFGKNGPGERTIPGVKGYGIGFTVTGSVKQGGIGKVETLEGTDVVNKNGAWTVQQRVTATTMATYEKSTEVEKNEVTDRDDGPRNDWREIKGNNVSYYDFPGPRSRRAGKGNLTWYGGDMHFTVRLVNGAQKCEVRFRVRATLINGKWTVVWGAF